MLEELHVRDLALIEDAWLEFGPGMTALTGETGAGKTALLGALKLLLGERADSGAVRAGAGEAFVEGRFASNGAETIAARRVSADGRSRCTLDDRMATVGALGEALGPLVDLHGQHEHQALLAASSHVGYLDRSIGEDAGRALEQYRTARNEYQQACTALAGLKERLASAERDAGYLRFVAEEIGRIAPEPGEDESLEARLPALQHAEKLAEAADEAAGLLRGDDSALDRVAKASAALARVSGIDPTLDALAERIAEIGTLAEDAGSEARSYRDAVDHDPDALEAVLNRLGELNGLVRKYGPRLEDVLRTRDDALESLAAFDAGEQGLSAAERAVADAETNLRATATALVALREAAIPGFVDQLGAAAGELAMDGARFEVSLGELPFDSWTADGPHRVEFLYAPAAGQPARPLARIASGGELSRVMLALKGVLGEADSVETLVFDEVDAGIGGATAHAVGRRLAELARVHQVIVVTHLAQVAAYADAQLVVSKRTSERGASTTVVPVEGDTRVAEIARMLSGNDSDASLAHARELLDQTEAVRQR